MLATNTHLGLLHGPDDIDIDDLLGEGDDKPEGEVSEGAKEVEKYLMTTVLPKALKGDKVAQATILVDGTPKVKAAYKAGLEAKLKTAKTDKEKASVIESIKDAGKQGIKFGTAVLSTVNKLSAELASARGKAKGGGTGLAAGGNTSMYIALGVAFVALILLTQKKK